MPRQRNRKPKSKGGRPGHDAPLQGIGETYQWLINDIQIPVVQSLTPGPATLRVSADMNGFAWQVTRNTQLLSNFPTTSQQSLWGDQARQFERIAANWTEYRVDWISVTQQPIGSGALIQPTGTYTTIDESAQLQGSTAPLTDPIPRLSSQKTTKVHSPYAKAALHLNYNKWLVQTQETAWKNTQDPFAQSQIIRQLYTSPLYPGSANPSSALGVTPGLYMATGFNVGSADNGVFLGALAFQAQFTFRQRKNLTGSPFGGPDKVFLSYTREDKVFGLQIPVKDLVDLVLGEQQRKGVTQPTEESKSSEDPSDLDNLTLSRAQQIVRAITRV